MIPEEVDLRELALTLKDQLGHDAPAGYLRGKSLMREVLVHRLGYSELESEELIDTLELQGFLRFLGDPSEPSHAADTVWDISPEH